MKTKQLANLILREIESLRTETLEESITHQQYNLILAIESKARALKELN